MPMFRKKPVVVEAEHFEPATTPWPAGVYTTGAGQFRVWDEKQSCHVRVNPGDWIITGVHGERYPCAPDVFDVTYEAAE